MAKRPSTAPHLGKTSGLRTPSNQWRWWRRHHGHREWGRNPSEIEPEKIKSQGRDRSRQRVGTMAMNGGKTDESPWSNGRAWGDEAIAPHGDGGARRSSPESSGIIAGDSKSPERGTG
jgi:hypothetical protein